MPDVSLIGEARPHELPLSQKLEVFTRIATIWSAHLNPREVCLVLWIAANTIGRGKRSGCYSLPQLVNGVPRKDGSGKWTDGTGLSLMTVRRVVASLREKGLIHTSQEERGTRFTLVPNWNPATGLAEESNVLSLNLPRAARRAPHLALVHVQAPAEDDQSEWGGVLTEQGGCSERTGGGVQSKHPSKGKPTKGLTEQRKHPDTTASRPVATLPEVRKRVRPAGYVAVPRQAENRTAPGNVEPSPHCAAPPPVVQLRDTVVGAIEQVQRDRGSRLGAMRQRKDANAYEVTWSAAWAETYPGRPGIAWTKKSAGMFKRAVSRWPEKALGGVHDFLDWTVRNWDAIRLSKLARLKTPSPTQPEIEFVARFISSFQEAWADKEELRWRGTLPGTRQAVLFQMRAKGVSEDVALAQVIADQRNEAERAKLEKIRADTRRDRHIAEIASETARRATRFTAANPHPRAAENAPYVPPRLIEREDAGEGFGVVSAVVFNMDDA